MGLITAGQSFAGKVGVAFSQTPAYTGIINQWALASGSSLPDGLSLNGTSGLISGTPTTKGNFSSLLDERLKAISIAAGIYHSLALKSDGTVVLWGGGFPGFAFAEIASIPLGLSGVMAIAGGYNHSLALKSDGTVVGWGNNGYGETTIPSGLSGVTAIAAGSFFSLALKNDGTVVGWGGSSYTFDLMVTGIPPGLSGVTAIDTGGNHALALKNNGTVVGWGGDANGKISIPFGLSGVTAIAAGAEFSLALKNDGTVVGWGQNDAVYKQLAIPSGLSGVTAIAAGRRHSLALKNDGTLVAWGWNNVGQATIPFGLSGVTAIAAGDEFSLALKNDGTLVAWGQNNYGQTTIPVESSVSVQFAINDGVPIITAGQTASGFVGAAFSKTFSLTDSTNRPVTSWAAVGLPSWATLNTTTGEITGAPQDTGSATISLTATGPGGTDTETAVISIAVGPPIITAGQTLSGKVGEAFSQTPSLDDALDRPVTSWSATGLPAGLLLNTTTGAITGTPTAKGSFTASFTAAGGGGTGPAANVVLTITEGAPIITAGQSLSGSVGTVFSLAPALTDATNRPVTSWAAVGLPSWATISSSTGIIAGTPAATSQTTVTINAAGPGGAATATILISILPGSPTILSGQKFAGKQGVSFSVVPVLADGVAVNWVASGLPAGLSINSSTGAITGTPAGQGEFTATLTAKSSGGISGSPTAVIFVIADPKSGSSFVPTNFYNGRFEVIRAQMLDDGTSVAKQFYTNKRFNGQYFVNARFKRVGALPPGISWESDSSGIRFYGVPQQIGEFEALFEGPYPDNFKGTTTSGESSIVCGGAPVQGIQTASVVNWAVKFVVTKKIGLTVSFGAAYRNILLRGRGDFSMYREKWTIATPATVPSPPLLGSVAHGSRQATIYFSAPLNNGGSSVTSYEYSLDSGNTYKPILVSVAVALQGYIISGLVNGRTYKIRVRAVNSMGPGDASNMISVIPRST